MATLKQRLTQGKLQRARFAVSALINGVHDARLRYRQCAHLRPRQLGVLSRQLKQMAAARGGSLEQEVELKLLLVRARRRVFGGGPVTKTLESYLPVAYRDLLDAFDQQSAYLLQVLSDVKLDELAPTVSE